MKIFTVPGLYNSGPQHWQTHWEKEHGFTRIEQQDWETPVCDDWLQTIDAVVTQHPLEKVILVGHSLACCTIVRWAEKYKRTIKGALLVGPSDVEASIVSSRDNRFFSYAVLINFPFLRLLLPAATMNM